LVFLNYVSKSRDYLYVSQDLYFAPILAIWNLEFLQSQVVLSLFSEREQKFIGGGSEVVVAMAIWNEACFSLFIYYCPIHRRQGTDFFTKIACIVDDIGQPLKIEQIERSASSTFTSPMIVRWSQFFFLQHQYINRNNQWRQHHQMLKAPAPFKHWCRQQ